MPLTSLINLSPFYAGTTMVNVVIETPKGATVKLKYDEKAEVFRVHKAMPVGFTFPFCFGFVPHTVAGDGDPLDALVLNENSMTPGAVIVGKILSVLEATQSEKGKPNQRNDRLIVAPWDLVTASPMLPEVSFDKALKHAISDFFTNTTKPRANTFVQSGLRLRTTELNSPARQSRQPRVLEPIRITTVPNRGGLANST